MKVMALLLLAILPVLPAPSAAQDSAPPRAPRPDRWQVQLADGQYLWDVRLLRASGDTLVVSRSDSAIAVPLQQIGELRLIRPSEMRVGAGARQAIGALSGADDEVYDLSTANLEERRRVVRQILTEHPPRAEPRKP